ncbi:MAG: diaminopimelate epimerase [Planctomycetota bacterium]
MRFTKMQGLGNDYVYIDCFDQTVDEPPELARKISDRHFGVGGDGMILIMPSDEADVRMRMFNLDGSEGEMCGNGVRCVAKYAYDHGRAKKNPMTVETLAGTKSIALEIDGDDKVTAATVDMGEPILAPEDIPVNIPQPKVVDAPIRAGNQAFQMTCVGMGNPHAAIYVDDLNKIRLAETGPQLETHPLFPAKMNVHFVQVHSPEEVTVLHWERGSGATLACGTGASAVCVAGVLAGRTGRQILAHLPGGDLRLEWRESDNHVYMTGPAVEVFQGEYFG